MGFIEYMTLVMWMIDTSDRELFLLNAYLAVGQR